MRRESIFAAGLAASCGAALLATNAAGAQIETTFNPRGAKRYAEAPAGPVQLAVAHDRRPGSLLIYPEFDNRAGALTMLTVTNVDSDEAATVTVEFVYLREDTCAEFNRVHTLTANDTLTLLTSSHNPNPHRGYVYLFARSGSVPIVWNALIGNLLLLDGIDVFDYGVNAISFLGIGDPGGVPQPNGTPTNLDGDGNRDLDGLEYAQVPEEILVPRFLGQAPPVPSGPPVGTYSELILIALSGGSHFTTRVDFLIYNDNEEVFSSEYEFRCWDKPALLDISGIFSNEFLQNNTNHAPGEIIGATQLESGWFRLNGGVANSTAEAILDPAVYCVLVERLGESGGADLPFSVGGQPNGSLLPRHILGDGDPTPMNGDNQ